MPWAVAAAGVSAAASIGGSMMASGASKSAAAQQEAAAEASVALQKKMFEQTQQNLAPWMQSGGALQLEAGSLFGATPGNPLVPGSGAAPAASPGVGGAAPAPAAPAAPLPPLTASSPAVTQLSGQLQPAIKQAIEAGQTSGTLPGGYTFTASVPTYDNQNGSFNLVGPNGQQLGTWADNDGSVGNVSNTLALNYGSNLQAGGGAAQPGAAGGGSDAGGGSSAPTVLGLNDSLYGIPSLGETNFFKAMGGNGPADFQFNPAEGSDFYKAMGVTGPKDLAFNPTQDQLNSLPGYQFELGQGQQAAANSAAAKGLGVSGAALKSAAQYGQGLASTDLNTYYNQWMGNLANQETEFGNNLTGEYNAWNGNLSTLSNVFNTSLMNRYNMNQGAITGAYNRMAGLSGLGENAAANAGNNGVQAGQNIGAATVGAGNAAASGTIGSSNALVGGLNSVAQAPMTYQMYKSIMNNDNAANPNVAAYGAPVPTPMNMSSTIANPPPY